MVCTSGRAVALGLALLSATTLSSPLFGQLLTQARADQPANPVASSYRDGVRKAENRQDLQIRSFDAAVTLRGAIAETTLSIQLAGLKGGDNDEAWLHVDLPKGAIVTGYALDIDGAMVDGSLVDADKARASYEQQVRGRVDPGLGEVDRTGGFNVRVFPVDSVKGRTVRLRFVAPAGADFALPINLPDNSGDWSVRVDGLDQSAKASIGTIRLTAAPSGSAVRRGKGRLSGALRLSGPDVPVLASRNPATGEISWQVEGPLPAATRPEGGAMRIYWDRSQSQKGNKTGALLQRIDDAIASLKPDRVELVIYNSQGAQRFTVANSAELAAKVRQIDYVGASSLAPIIGDAAGDTCLLVSDGRSTVASPANAMLPCRVLALAAGEQADLASLSALAERNGGRLINPTDRNINWRAGGIDRVIDAAGNPVEFALLPSDPGRYRLIAAHAGGGPLRLISAGQTINVTSPTSAPSAFAGDMALIASRRLAELGQTGDRAAFVAMSRRYSIASPSLSFIVLEEPDDYVRHDIVPSPGYPQMDEYREARQEADKEADSEKAGRFDDLLSDWEDEVDWWKTDFDPSARPTQPGKQRPSVPGVATPSLPAPPPPPPPPPPAMAEAVAPVANQSRGMVPPPPEPERDGSGYSDDNAQIVVTGSVIRRTEVEIAPTAFNAERDYLRALDADPKKADATIAEWEPKAGGVPSYYLDVSDWMMRQGRRDRAIELLLSALDLPTSDNVTNGMAAARLERWGLYDLAIDLRRRQLLADDRPQIRRLLALAYAARAKANPATAKADYGEAIRLLTSIALGPIDDRWEGLDVIALREANALIPRYRALGGTVDLDPRLIANLDSDVRIVIDWSADAVDLDLWVDEPNGERAIYSHPHTAIGGRMSNDMTQGYGPEDYWLRRAPVGTFTVRTNNYASDRIDPNGAPRVTVRMIRDFGRPTEKEDSVDLELTKSNSTGNNDERIIGKMKFGPGL